MLEAGRRSHQDAAADPKSGLKAILTGMGSLSYGELAV